MNILPFVLTFLLLLTVVSSFLFTSTFRTAREKTVILTAHKAYLGLLSEQKKTIFEKKKLPPKLVPGSKGPKTPKTKEPKDINEFDRNQNKGEVGGKINLFSMIHGNDTQISQALEKTLVRLMDLLYSSYPFYQADGKKNIASSLVKEMILQKIETFEELKLEDSALDRIYYTMLKGTNTGYPSLTEYCLIDKKPRKPIHFRYTTIPVIQASLGDELAQKVLKQEKKNHLENSGQTALKKKELLDIAKLHPTPWISQALLTDLFEYRKTKKGIPQTYREGNDKIRAFHEAEERY